MTPRDRNVLDFVRRFIDDHGHSPTLTEIAIGTGLSATSKANARTTVERLVSQGYLARMRVATAR
jgi:SOS-response transcriptional repressor LexA